MINIFLEKNVNDNIEVVHARFEINFYDLLYKVSYDFLLSVIHKGPLSILAKCMLINDTFIHI